MIIIDIITGKYFREKSEQRRLEIKKTVDAGIERARKLAEAELERRAVYSIMKYPTRHITSEELSELPKIPGECTADFLKTCPLGTWFVCKPNRFLPDTVVVGKVVAGKDLLEDQWGAVLSIPERGVNRYTVVID